MRQRINPLVNLGRTSPVAQRVAANTYVAAARAIANQWWLPAGIVAADVVAAYQPRGADDAADALVNLALPGTRNATYHTTPVRWDRANGWWNTPPSVSAGAAIGPALGADYTVAMAIKVKAGAVAGNWCSFSGTGSGFSVTSISGPALQVRLGTVSNILTLPGGDTVRTLALADHAAYADGVSAGTVSGTAELAATQTLVIGNTSAFASPFSGEIHAVAVFNKPLTAAQALALHDAMRRI